MKVNRHTENTNKRGGGLVVGTSRQGRIMGAPQPQPSPTYLILEMLNSALLQEQDLSIAALTHAQQILAKTTIPAALNPPDIEGDPEELDLTWRKNGKTLKLITYSAKLPHVYYHVDGENAFSRGHLIPGDPDSLTEKLNWLLAK